jgi:sortase A
MGESGLDFFGAERPSGSTATSPRPNSTGDYIRAGIRGLGQTLVTLGLVVLLFVVYEVWITNIFADQKQSKVKHALVQAWADGKSVLPPSVDRLHLPAGAQAVLPAGKGFANLYIPRLGKDYAYTIVEGVGDAQLEEGPGHYSTSALPGQVGDFAVAGHRVGKGEPFLNIDHLKPGDSIVVQTKDDWFVYHVLGDVATGNLATENVQGVPGQQVVPPSNYSVVAPVPGHDGQTPTLPYMTLTTCTPKFSATDRLIVHAVLFRSFAAQGSALPEELAGGTL